MPRSATTVRSVQPENAAVIPISQSSTCARASHTTSCPCCVCSRIATWFPIVPVGTYSAASRPNTSAPRASSRFTVGSSPYTSSPTSAAAIAARIFAVGRVTVSLRKSIKFCSFIQSSRHHHPIKSSSSSNQVVVIIQSSRHSDAQRQNLRICICICCPSHRRPHQQPAENLIRSHPPTRSQLHSPALNDNQPSLLHIPQRLDRPPH